MNNASRSLYLIPCSSKSKTAHEIKEEEEEGNQNEAIVSTRLGVKKKKKMKMKMKMKKGIILSSKRKRKHEIASSSSSSASSCITTTQKLKGGERVRGRRDDDGGLQDLALSIGMSFAAIVSQVLDGISGSRGQIPIERLSSICVSAVKEPIEMIYGNRFDCFLLNFEKSFVSTLRTLRLINEASATGHGYESSQVPDGEPRNRTANKPSSIEQRSSNYISSSSRNSCEVAKGDHETLEKFEDIPPLTTLNTQIVPHGELNRELVSTRGFEGPGFNQSILSTFEKSVMEQTRSNDLKAFEIGLITRKLQLKESQLAISSYANMLEKVKITMGTLKASFREEKLRNQMLDTRHADFLRRCIDLLVSGLIIMSGCLCYGAYIYSYHRITEATSSCSAIPEESSSWWIPKPMASFNSGWHILRCHVVSLTRMFFGLAMILSIAYFVFQRSAVSTPTAMPVTFILLLGFLCGIAGKLCVDTLGGSGFYWLLHWEALCLIHFFVSVFPSVLYKFIYGPIHVSQVKSEGKIAPYWFRRFMFNFTLAIVYPALSGLLPFASLGDWKNHFIEKIQYLIVGAENQG